MTDYKGIKAFDELVEKEHGVVGSDSRNTYEENATRFIVSEMHKEARRESKETQDQLDEKAGFQLSEGLPRFLMIFPICLTVMYPICTPTS